jgi:hypothetical protein
VIQLRGERFDDCSIIKNTASNKQLDEINHDRCIHHGDGEKAPYGYGRLSF